MAAPKSSVEQDPSLEELEIVDLTEPPAFDWDDEDTVVSGLTCIAIVGIEDPVRDEVGVVCVCGVGICVCGVGVGVCVCAVIVCVNSCGISKI